MNPLFFPLVAIVATGLSSSLRAEVFFFDEFNTPGSSSSSGWYVRGENLEDEKNVEEGNLRLARKDSTQPVPRAGGVWKSFCPATLNEGESLRLTIAFSGAEAESAPFFRVVLADSPSPIVANGGVLAEPAPRFIYTLGLPSGNFDSTENVNVGFFEGASGSQPSPGSPFVAPCLMAHASQISPKPVFLNPSKVLESGRYADKTVLVWELRNEGGVIVSRGSWTGLDGKKVDFLEVRAELVQHFDFNKIGIGFSVWDADWDAGQHLAESVLIDSVRLEKF